MVRLPLIPRTLALCAVLVALGCGGGDDNNKGNNTIANNTTANNTTVNNTTVNNTTADCEGVANACATPGSSCAGDSAVVCAQDANGCLVETTTDCAANGEVCQGGACQPPAACDDDAACDGLTDGARFCTGDTLTTCTAGADGCLDASTNDCAAMGQSCDVDTQMCVGACMDDAACAGRADGDSFCQADGGATISCALNAGGCLVATTTACGMGQVCDAAGGTPMCVADTCAPSIRTLSCADAGMTISGDTANGTSVLDGNECPFADPGYYSGPEAVYVFSDAAANEVSIAITYDDTTAMDVDVFALEGTNGSCTDPTLACAGYEWAGGGVGELVFAAAAGARTYLVLEVYDEPGATTTYGLTINCTPTVCGDGVIADTEECDDGNAADGDGCSSLCFEEANYICSGEPSNCVPDVCGDGILSPTTEECDDNNLTDGDGCSATCGREFGYNCTSTGCTAATSLGTYAGGDMIPDTMGGPIAAGESVVYTITFTTPVVFSGSATRGMTGDVDAVVSDPSGAWYVEDNFGDETFDPLLLPAGTYEIVLYASGSTDVDTYTLALVAAAINPTDLGSFDINGMPPVTTGGPLPSGDSAWYTVTFLDDVLMTGTLTSDTGDVDLYLYSPDGEFVIGSGGAGNQDFAIGVLAGTYIVEVWSRSFTAVGTYTLTWSPSALGATDLGSVAAGGTIADQTGALAAGATAFYKVTFTTDVTLDGTLGGNTTGETGVWIYSATDFGISAYDFGDEVFTGDLVAGTYLIAVLSYQPSGAVDAYTLTLDPN